MAQYWWVGKGIYNDPNRGIRGKNPSHSPKIPQFGTSYLPEGHNPAMHLLGSLKFT